MKKNYDKYESLVTKLILIIMTTFIIASIAMLLTSCSTSQYPADWKFHKKTASNHKVKPIKVHICNNE